MTISIAYAVLIGIVTFLVGFLVAAGFGLQRQDELEDALAWMLYQPENAEAQRNAQEVLKR